jgi:hypothetical protein
LNAKKLQIIWPGRGFGEQLLCAKVSAILNDNNFDVILKERYKIAGLVDCKKIPYLSSQEKYSEYEQHIWMYSIYDRTPIVLQYIKHFEEIFEKEIKVTRNEIPVVFYKIDIPTYDVILHTNTGSWSIYRMWPYFEELKSLLTNVGISWLDIADRKNGRIGGIQYLNYVDNAKLYVGLETGPSHYISSIAKNKTLIIQSGFAEYNFWAYGYQFDHLEIDVPCRPCFLNINDIKTNKGCPNNHKCMREIGPKDVFNKIEKMLNDRS